MLGATALDLKIETLISPAISTLGYDLVRVSVFSEDKRKILQIMIERPEEKGINVDDCAKVSRAASVILDVEDPIDGEYDLEVTSPGIERPLVKPEDFERFAGEKVKLSLTQAFEGRKQIKGTLSGIEDNVVSLVPTDSEATVELPYDSLASAKLSL